jgi:uncharacterized protein YbaR (Trm112 family)
MTSADLEMYRCPLDPSRTRLILQDGKLRCERCALRFAIRDDVPCLVAEEAELPAGCASLAELPCQASGSRPSGPGDLF